MSSAEPRTIEELSVRYEFEPTIADVFVEGGADKGLVKWFLEANGRNAFVYEIDTVDVPLNLIEELEQEHNNRGRVITLAHRLADLLGNDSRQVTGIIDKDFDLLLGITHPCSLLLSTDYACMEMYAFNVVTMEKFLGLVVRGFPKTAEVVLTELGALLQELFLVRLANKLTKLRLTAVSWEKCCTFVESELTFDVEEYVTRYLNANAKLPEKEVFMVVVADWRLKLSDDPRNHIQGHDFTELLSWYIYRHRGIKELNNPAVIQRALFASVEKNELANEPLFKALLDRL